MMTQLTITGALINKTLFEQAGVAVPGDKATWDEWAEAARKVAKATETPFPMAMDRSGHRLAGPAISNGAKFFDADGKPQLVDEGFSETVRKFVDWNQDGTMAKEVWGGQGGSTYQDAAQEFINGQLVYYFSGSWQVGRFDEAIGDAFDWEVVGPPCGPGGCTGMPGGAGLVGFKETQHPGGGRQGDRLSSPPSPSTPSSMVRTRTCRRTRGWSRRASTIRAPRPPEPQRSRPGPAGGEHLAGRLPAPGLPRQPRRSSTSWSQRITQAIVGEMSADEALERIDGRPRRGHQAVAGGAARR